MVKHRFRILKFQLDNTDIKYLIYDLTCLLLICGCDAVCFVTVDILIYPL